MTLKLVDFPPPDYAHQPITLLLAPPPPPIFRPATIPEFHISKLTSKSVYFGSIWFNWLRNQSLFLASITLHIHSTSSSTLSLKLFKFWGNELAAAFQQLRLISDIYLLFSKIKFLLNYFYNNFLQINFQAFKLFSALLIIQVSMTMTFFIEKVLISTRSDAVV